MPSRSIVGATLTVTVSIGKGLRTRPSMQLSRPLVPDYHGFMRRSFLSVIGVMFSLLLPLSVAAQTEGLAKVSAKLNQSALRPGDEAVLAVVVDIAEGYHAQSNKPLETYLIPFTVKLENHPALEAGAPLYPEAHIE